MKRTREGEPLREITPLPDRFCQSCCSGWSGRKHWGSVLVRQRAVRLVESLGIAREVRGEAFTVGPIVFDNTVGSIGFFEIVEHLLFVLMVVSGTLMLRGGGAADAFPPAAP